MIAFFAFASWAIGSVPPLPLLAMTSSVPGTTIVIVIGIPVEERGGCGSTFVRSRVLCVGRRRAENC